MGNTIYRVGSKGKDVARKFQGDFGLTVDGEVGNETMGSLTGSGASNGSSNSDSTYKPFERLPFNVSDATKKAQNAIDTHLTKNPGAYNTQWQAQLDDIYNKIMGREDFSYDFNSDALYQQYKDKYMEQGKMAMADTMGQAAAMTGGYGNSYAQTVGQQVYNQHLDNLNDIIPELYQMAYDRYKQEGQDLYNQYGMIADRENTDYGRYRDSVTDWQSDRGYLADRADKLYDRDFDKYTVDEGYRYQDHANAIELDKWLKSYDLDKRRVELSEEELELAKKKITESEVDTKVGGSDLNTTNISNRYNKDIQRRSDNYGGDGNVTMPPESDKETQDTKHYSDFSMEEYNKVTKENGGSYYGQALNDLKAMKKAGKSNAEASAFLDELVGNSLLLPSDYTRLYQKYRDNKL